MTNRNGQAVNALLEDLITLLEQAAGPASADKEQKTCFCETQAGTGLPEEGSVAMLFYDAETCRVFPFEHILRICPWLNERSVMRKIPGMEGIYFLYEEDTEVETDQGSCLAGPIVVIRLSEDHFLLTPDALDRHRIRKFMKDNTVTAEFEEGNSYEVFRRI